MPCGLDGQSASRSPVLPYPIARLELPSQRASYKTNDVADFVRSWDPTSAPNMTKVGK